MRYCVRVNPPYISIDLVRSSEFCYKPAEQCQCHTNCNCQAERQSPWTSCLFSLKPLKESEHLQTMIVSARLAVFDLCDHLYIPNCTFLYLTTILAKLVFIFYDTSSWHQGRPVSAQALFWNSPRVLCTAESLFSVVSQAASVHRLLNAFSQKKRHSSDE